MTDSGSPRSRSLGRTPVQSAFLACESKLKRFVSRISRGGADVDDIAHEALVSALRAEADHAIDHPEAYLYHAARNLALKVEKKKSREILGFVEAASDSLPSAEPSVEDQVISRERFALFCEVVATLPPNCRRVFVMRKVYGYSHREISERLDISTSTVEKHLATGFARCVAALRAREHAERRAPRDADSPSPPKTVKRKS